MSYFLAFLEGMISFISPCLLPMLPIYLSYFAAGKKGERSSFRGALAFIAGFTLVFTLLGALAGTLGSFLGTHQKLVNILCGTVIVLFGLSYLDILPVKWFSSLGEKWQFSADSIRSAFLFGVTFAIGWTPCVGAFLGSALMLASASGTVLQGILMLLLFSLGLGIPFLLSALLMDSLKNSFDWIKAHYRLINTLCGLLLIVTGILMAFGLLGQLQALLL